MAEFLSCLSIIGTASLEIWAAVPLGFVLGLNPLLTCLLTITGALISTIIVILAGDWLRRRVSRYAEAEKEDRGRKGLVKRIWNKYGVVGLGLLAPFITGALLGTIIGIALGVPGKRLMLWMSLGIVICSVTLTLAGLLGMEGLKALFGWESS